MHQQQRIRSPPIISQQQSAHMTVEKARQQASESPVIPVLAG
jgi:hypothetical protein